MSGQEIEPEEHCLNCGDGLRAPYNWDVKDVASGQMYCTKEECQKAKPEMINSTSSPRRQKKKRERDPGLSHILKPKNMFAKYTPDPDKVAAFGQMLEDPRMQNDRGMPKYSKMFKEYGVNSWVKGYSCEVMAVKQYPEEVDEQGRPSIRSVKAIKGHLKRLTVRFKGNLEIYSQKGIVELEDGKFRTEWRWFALKEQDDLNKQVDEMLKIARNIELAAKQREQNFSNKTYDERMKKVDILDQFFDQE